MDPRRPIPCNGEQIESTSERNSWQETGKQKWRVRGTLCNSLGDVDQSDGEISLRGGRRAP